MSVTGMCAKNALKPPSICAEGGAPLQHPTWQVHPYHDEIVLWLLYNFLLLIFFSIWKPCFSQSDSRILDCWGRSWRKNKLYYYLYQHVSYFIILEYCSSSNFVNSLLILELKHGIQAKENRMSLCLLVSKGVVKPQHVARWAQFLCCSVVCS